ncbi:hypothetical protein N7540_010912 [Penicillium herquei]|nr:hypothetical protein N7540_010912 [Penicillium herquei]
MTSSVTLDNLEDVSQMDVNSNLDFPTPALQRGPCSSPETTSPSYKGYKFFKADPIPGQKASWTKVERMDMDLSQSELRKKVQKRADKVSAAHQYQTLSEIRQAHVNQLIHEHRQMYPEGDWSCVYAKQRERAAKARNANREDYETVSMQVILMQRPLQTRTHPRTPMGELIDLREFDASHTQVGPNTMEPPSINSLRYQSLPPIQWMEKRQTWPPSKFSSDLGVQDRPIRSMTVDGTMQAQRDELVQNEILHNSNKENKGNIEKPSTTPSESNLNRDTEMEGSNVEKENGPFVFEGASKNDHCQDPSPFQPSIVDIRGLHIDALPDSSTDAIPATSSCSTKRPRASTSDLPISRSSDKKVCIHRKEEEEIWSRLLKCEARMERWEKTLHDHTKILQMILQSPSSLQCFAR